jgi:hypothetical protein
MDVSEAKQLLMSEQRLTYEGRIALQFLLDAWNDLATAAQHAHDLAEGGAACDCCRLGAARVDGRCFNCVASIDRALASAGHETTTSKAARRLEAQQWAQRERTLLSQVQTLRDLVADIRSAPHTDEGSIKDGERHDHPLADGTRRLATVLAQLLVCDARDVHAQIDAIE